MKRLLAFLWFLLIPLTALADFEAHFIDVGHGDCCIIICDGEAMIIDGGDAKESDKIFSIIKDLGITDLKYVIATHPQTDHVGGLASVFYAATVHAIYTPLTTGTNDRFEMLMDKAVINNVPVIVPAPGDTFTLGGATATIIAPIKQYKDVNDMSIVLRIDYGSRSFLFCGDAGTSVEKALLKDGAVIEADVIKMPHHGSKSGGSGDFIQAVNPRYAVISCSARYDNPDQEVIDNLYTVPYCEVLRTDVNGDIIISTDGTSLGISAEYYYIGNVKSDILHRYTCPSVAKMKDENKDVIFTTNQAEINGYRPCKNCSP